MILDKCFVRIFGVEWKLVVAKTFTYMNQIYIALWRVVFAYKLDDLIDKLVIFGLKIEFARLIEIF